MAVLLLHREWLSSLTKITDSSVFSGSAQSSNSDGARFPRLWKRLAADGVDSLVLDILSLVLIFGEVGFWDWVNTVFKGQSEEGVSSLDLLLRGADAHFLLLLFILPRGVLSIFYYSEGHYRFGTTLGKRLFGIFVYSFHGSGQGFGSLTRKQSYLRTLHYLTSYATFGVGFIWAIFSDEKRALHDLLAKTVCVARASE